jgi:phosphate transport system permease protein
MWFFRYLFQQEHSASRITPFLEENAGNTLFLNVEEQNEVASRITDTGQVIYFSANSGKVIGQYSVILPEGATIVSAAMGTPMKEAAIAFGLSNGQVIVIKQVYKSDYSNNQRVIIPTIEYPLGEKPLDIDPGVAVEKIAFKYGEGSTTVVAKLGSKVRVAKFEKSQSLFSDDVELSRTDRDLEIEGDIFEVLVDKEERNMFVVTRDGQLSYVDISKEELDVKQQLQHCQVRPQSDECELFER